MTDNNDNRLTAIEEKSTIFDEQLKRQQVEIADLQRRLTALENFNLTDKDAEAISTIAERVEAIESRLTESEKPESSSTTTVSKNYAAPVEAALKPESTLASEIEIPRTEAISATKPVSSTSTASTVASKLDLPKTNQASLENINEVVQLQNRIKRLEKEKKELLKHNKYNIKRKNASYFYKR